MVEHIQNVNVFICERILYEHDGVLSAIRLVDIFSVPEDRPADFRIAFTFVAIIKFKPGYIPPDSIPMRVTLVRINNEREVLGEQPLQIPNKQVPGPIGVGLILQIQIIPRNLGTAYLEAAIGDEAIASIPFTLSPQPQPRAAQQ